MSTLQAIFLGILQGLTEFLPVSSSGHLVLVQHFMGVRGESHTGASPVFELILHLGTLFAVVIYFRKQLFLLLRSLASAQMKEERKLILMLFLGTLPVVLAVLCFGDQFKAAYDSPRLTACLLVATGTMLLLPRVLKVSSRDGKDVSCIRAVWMGIGQAVAILPGISRSGSTIVAGMLVGVKPEKAAEFSFLLAIPAILGAVVYERDAFSDMASADLVPYAAGFLAALVSGLFAVYLVLAMVR